MGTRASSAGLGTRTCMRCWSSPKSGRPAAPNVTISPSSSTRRAPTTPVKAASSGYPPVTSLPLRLYNRHRSPATVAMARTPSHLNSNAQPAPDGGLPAQASIGATGSGSSKDVPVITTQLALKSPAPRPDVETHPVVSEVPQRIGQEPDGLGGRSGFDTQSVHDLEVVLDILSLVQVERAGELFEVHDVGQVGFGKPQDRERTTHRHVRAERDR